MKTLDYIEAVKKKLDLPSDYAAAKALGISRQAISNYRAKTNFLDDAVALRVAEILGISEAEVLLNCHIERSKLPQVRVVFESVLEVLVSAAIPRRRTFSA